MRNFRKIVSVLLRRNNLAFYICLTLVTILVLIGCSAERTQAQLGSVAVGLPGGISSENTAGNSIVFSKGAQTIGGLTQYDAPDCPFPSNLSMEDTMAYLQALGLPEAADDTLDYMASSSAYGDLQVWFGSDSLDEIHYLYRTDAAVYDLWFDKTSVDGKTEKEILESVSFPAGDGGST